MPETLNYQNRAIAYSVLAHIYDKGTLAHGPLDIFIPIHYCPVKAGKSVFEIVET